MNKETAAILLNSLWQRAQTGHAVRFSEDEITALRIVIIVLEQKQTTIGGEE